ncbi:MAG: HD domain-containing protein [Desulfobacteraceae bacterium]|jgi:putative nucleotidyltransferase with HDIG domain
MKLRLPDNLFDDLPQAYLVGGSVRDLIRGVEPEDYDIAVSPPPEEFARIMANRLNGKIIRLGKERFNLYRIVSDTFRVDITNLKYNDIDRDLKDRDFTINAIACDLSTGKIIDTAGGLGDLRNHAIKMVSPDAFKADPVRLIRAFRMAATLDFNIEEPTLEAITHQAAAIRQTAGERVWTELEMIMACQNSVSTIRDMASTQLLFYVIPELSELQGCSQNSYHICDAFNHTLRAYQAMERELDCPNPSLPDATIHFITEMTRQKRIRMKMATLLHDIGKPATRTRDLGGEVHFYGHATQSALMARKICQRLRMSNRQQSWIETVVRYHHRPLSLYLAQQRHPLRPKAVGRFFRQCGRFTPYILIHAIADAKGKEQLPADREIALHDFYGHLLSTCLKRAAPPLPNPVIDGNDLMEIFKIPPSPLLGKILRGVEELQIAGSLNGREETLRWVSTYLDARK